jgi:hypothetical protein
VDACAKAGTAGRKPIESAGDTVSRDDMEALLDYARDVIGLTLCLGNLLVPFEYCSDCSFLTLELDLFQ